MDLVSLGYFGMLIAAFLAATVLPFSSEAVFTGLYLADFDPFWLVVWATVGNTLGGMTCYLLGFLGKIEWIERWLKIPQEKAEKWKTKVHKYGDGFAFFSFLPGVGDFIAVAAGLLRCRWWVVFVSMALGKLARYVVWMYGNEMIMQ